ncbi:hypothetical protein GCM10027589_22320 [Actinocorallia lasiicapitis]
MPNNFGIDTRTLRRALVMLSPDGEPKPPDRDAAYLVGRLLAKLELAAGSGGRSRDWASFDAGYRSAVDPAEPPVVALKRLMRTARQLTDLPGTAAKGAATGLIATSSILFAEVLLRDDDSTLDSTLEQLAEARTLFTKTIEIVDGLRAMLAESVPPD